MIHRGLSGVTSYKLQVTSHTPLGPSGPLRRRTSSRARRRRGRRRRDRRVLEPPEDALRAARVVQVGRGRERVRERDVHARPDAEPHGQREQAPERGAHRPQPDARRRLRGRAALRQRDVAGRVRDDRAVRVVGRGAALLRPRRRERVVARQRRQRAAQQRERRVGRRVGVRGARRGRVQADDALRMVSERGRVRLGGGRARRAAPKK